MCNVRGTLRHIIFPVPSLKPDSPSSPLATARTSDLAMRALQIILLHCIVMNDNKN